MSALLEVFVVGVGGLFFVLLFVSWANMRFRKPSDFAAGIARSIVVDWKAWDYSDDEQWLRHDEASLSIGVAGGNFGHVWTREPVNRGTRRIERCNAPDDFALRRAYKKWKSLSAADRREVAEVRKEKALHAMQLSRVRPDVWKP